MSAINSLSTVAKPAPTAKPKIEEAPDSTHPKPSTSEKPKPKATGKLDWSKAKPKETKKEPARVKTEDKPIEASKLSKTSTSVQQVRVHIFSISEWCLISIARDKKEVGCFLQGQRWG